MAASILNLKGDQIRWLNACKRPDEKLKDTPTQTCFVDSNGKKRRIRITDDDVFLAQNPVGNKSVEKIKSVLTRRVTHRSD